jgi:hypothetical protein
MDVGYCLDGDAQRTPRATAATLNVCASVAQQAAGGQSADKCTALASGGVALKRGVPLALALAAAAPPLATAAPAHAAHAACPLRRWLAGGAAGGAGAVAARAGAASASLLELASAEGLEALGADCAAGCVALGKSPAAAFDLDAALPAAFLAHRAVGSAALEAAAGLGPALGGPGALPQAAAATATLLTPCAAFVCAAADAYGGMWPGLPLSAGEHVVRRWRRAGARRRVDRRRSWR